MEDSRSADAQAASAAAPYPFFPVSTHKFIVLCICSFGLYELYWCYQQWKRLAESSGEALSPFWRAVFAPIFCFSLFTRIRLAAELAGLPAAWPPMLLGAIYFVMSACWRLPEPWFLLGFATVIPMVPAQHTARRLNARFEGLNNEPANEGYSKANIAMIIVGGLWLMLVLLGTFLPEPEELEQGTSPPGFTFALRLSR